MKIAFNSGMVGFTLGFAIAAVSAQAAVQRSLHEHQMPSAQKPAAGAMRDMEGMKDMGAMMADPAMRSKMLERMGQCRDVMSMMMDHMKQEGKMGDGKRTPTKH